MASEDIKTPSVCRAKPMKWLWPVVSIVIPVVLFCVCLLNKPMWMKLGMAPMDPTYADTLAILTSVDALNAGADPYAKPNPFDPFGRPHVYGPWWLELRRFGLTSEDRAWIGTVLLLTSIAVMVHLCRPRNFVQMLATVLLVASPPFILAFERGNNDLVIVLMLSLSGFMLSGSAWWRTAISASIVWFAAALKLYPLAAAPMLFSKRGRVQGWIAVIAVVLGFVVIRLLYDNEFSRALSAMPKPDSCTTYGFRVIELIWNTPGMLHGWFSVGFAAGLSGWVWVAVRARKEGLCLNYLDYYWVGGAACWVLCYFANTNYAYRAVLLTLPVAVWLRQASETHAKGRLPGAWAVVFTLVLMWIRVRHPSMEAISTHNGLRLAATTLGVENGLSLGLTLYLSWAGLNWALPRFRIGKASVSTCAVK